VVFGIAPALQATRVDVMPALKGSRGASPDPRRFLQRVSMSQILVAGQIAISLLMLFAAGLFVRTLSNLESIDLGFNRENVLLFQLDARRAGHKDPEIPSFTMTCADGFARLRACAVQLFRRIRSLRREPDFLSRSQAHRLIRRTAS
jgi:hypothetical protein